MGQIIKPELIKLSENAMGSIFCTSAAMDQIQALAKQMNSLKCTNLDLLNKHSPENILNYFSVNPSNFQYVE